MDPDEEFPMPAPTVTHMAMGENGKDIVTVDTVWTENRSIGSSRGSRNVCTSIKFWLLVDSSAACKADQRKRRIGDVPMSYELVSCMTSPHGREGEVCALAVARAGDVACTLSRGANDFRVWAKDAAAAGGAAPRWKCQYKIRSPAGYANLLAGNAGAGGADPRLATFSSDGTVLAVAYGPRVALWDHASAKLLTDVTLDGDDTTGGAIRDIQSVDFLPNNMDAAILLSTLTQIGVKSPFGGGQSSYLGEDEWSFDFDILGTGATITAAVPLAGRDLFAIATFDKASKSVVSVISRDEGNVICAEGTDIPLQWHLDNEVQSLCLDKCTGPSMRLLAITKKHQLLSLSCGADTDADADARKVAGLPLARTSPARAPVLQVGAFVATPPTPSKRRKISIGAARGRGGAADFDFPALSGRFTSAFIAESFGNGS